MSSQLERRLQALESQRQQQPVLGYRAFWESDQPGLFCEGAERQGPGYTREALSELSSQGWRLIMVRYVDWNQ